MRIDKLNNILTGLRNGIDYTLRHSYNIAALRDSGSVAHAALFYFLREYCYSSMFRYNQRGEVV